MVGLLAYSIYKREKIAYICAFKEEHDLRGPTPEELKDFHRMSAGRVEQYRSIAESEMERFTQEVFDHTVEVLDKKYEKELSSRIRSMKPSWLAGAAQSLAGSVLYTFLLGAIVVLILGVRFGAAGVVQEVLKMFGGV